MPSRLILNADDFGLTRGINRAVGELHRAGVLTSATLMANGPAFADAVALAKGQPGLGVGCHIVLVDGVPVSRAEDVPTLLGRGGVGFRRSLLDFAKALLRGAIREEEIVREAVAQIEKMQRAGVLATHLDTHKHTHFFPAVCRSLRRAAEETGMRSIRNPFEPRWALEAGLGSITRRAEIELLKRAFEGSFRRQIGALTTTDGTFGIAATGGVEGAALARLLGMLPASGTWELVVHPGYNDAALAAAGTRLLGSRETERLALLAEVPKLLLSRNAPELIDYRSLGVAATIHEPSAPETVS